MKATFDLPELYQQWRELSVQERAAILSESWSQVGECQAAKSTLQPLIIEATDRWQNHHRAIGQAPGGNAEPFREMVNELIALEMANHDLLGTQLEQVRQHRSELDRAARSLGQVQRSYGTRRGSNWNSYS